MKLLICLPTAPTNTLLYLASNLFPPPLSPGEGHHAGPPAPGQGERGRQPAELHPLPPPAHVPAALRPRRHHRLLRGADRLQHGGGVVPGPAPAEGTVTVPKGHNRQYMLP